MSHIYLRVKHFVAAWLRHNYGGGPDDPGKPINIGHMTAALEILNLVQCNVNDKVIPHCFCERQWMRMMRGEHISRDYDDFMCEVRDQNIFLAESEVCALAGVEPMRGESMGEYVCIAIPSEVRTSNGTAITNSQWQLMHNAASKLADLLDEAFDDALFDYIDRSVRAASKLNMDRYTSDALEAFMSRNDIRNCTDDREKRCLWRRYYRYMERNGQSSDAPEADDEFFTGKERQRSQRNTSSQDKAVMCCETGQQWPSIWQAAKEMGVGYSALRMSIKRGYKCGGFSWSLV